MIFPPDTTRSDLKPSNILSLAKRYLTCEEEKIMLSVIQPADLVINYDQIVSDWNRSFPF